MEPARPLSGVHVLDVGGPLLAYAAKLLADLGADVLGVEPPQGDPLRAEPPYKDGESLAFAYYRGNTRGVTLDVTREEARGLLRELAGDADLVLVSPTPDRPVVGLDAANGRLDWARDDAVVVSLTPFGLTGPLAGWRMTPMTSFAISGLMSRMGPLAGPPTTAPGRLAWDQAAVHAVVTALAALRVRRNGGQLLDLSVHDVLTAQDAMVERFSLARVVMTREVGSGYPPSGAWSCLDGQIEFQVHTERHWAGFVSMLDDPPELADPALAGRLERINRTDELREVVGGLLAQRSRYELVERGQSLGVPCGLLNDPEQFTSDEQMRDRGFVVDRPHPTLGSVIVPGAPFHATPPLLGYDRPAPTLGQDNEAVYVRAHGHSATDLDAWKVAGLV
jgi:crotonobetainyl-CoA:carnitine CoA-transferase CaiB-like acyl-CoA transferase